MSMVLAVAFACALAAPCVALGCSFAPSFEPATFSDDPPPDASLELPSLSLTKGDVRRGTGPERAGCGQATTSCDDIGVIELFVEGFDPELAYRFEFEGLLPQGLSVPQGPVRILDASGLVTLHWNDGASDAQEAFDFRVSVTPVDPYGRPGEASAPLVVAHQPAGCAAAPANSGALTALLALGVLAAFRRRFS